MDFPLGSVIIPTFSRPVFLKRALESVFNQTWSNIELIVVDDNGKGSLNQLLTEKVVEEYTRRRDFQYLMHSVNQKGAAARNTGSKHAAGEFITFLDDDDELMPIKIEWQVEILKYTQ